MTAPTDIRDRIMARWRYFIPDDGTGHAAVLFGRLTPARRFWALAALVSSYDAQAQGDADFDMSPHAIDAMETRVRRLYEDIVTAEHPEWFDKASPVG